MTKLKLNLPKQPLSFRFSEDFVTQLRTWAFVTEMDQRSLLEEALKDILIIILILKIKSIR